MTELRRWSRLRAMEGERAGTASWVRSLLDVPSAPELAAVEARLDGARVDEAHPRLDLAFELVETVFPLLARHYARHVQGETRARAARGEDPVPLDETLSEEQETGRLWARFDLLRRIVATETVLALAPLEHRPLISVVVPTHQRRALLDEAVASVKAQTYDRWELVVVADRCTDGTAAWLDDAASADPRIRWATADAGNCGAARNVGLALASGDAVAYLDDDNMLHPGWLRAVAWALEAHPDDDVFYGAVAFDGPEPGLDRHELAAPQLFFEPFDRERLARENFIDQGAIAHRAGIGGARFDEGIGIFNDWELIGRLSADRDPVPIPAVAALYRTAAAPDRLTAVRPVVDEVEVVRARLRPLLGGAEDQVRG